MNMLKWIIAIIIVLGAVSYAIAQYLVYFILNRNAKYRESSDSLSKDPEEVKRAIQMFCGDESWKQQIETIGETWSLLSYDNLKLYGLFLKRNSHNYIIICHGFTGTHREVQGRAEHFYKNNYSVLMPDARAHGQSEGTYRGMGYLEKDDIKKWIQKIIDLDPNANIVLMGQSMGAATVMMTASQELPAQVKCVIQDCGYTSVWDEFSAQLKIRYHLPSFPIMDIANYISKRKVGYSFKDASPLKMIGQCRLPILMIHGEEDSFVPYEYLDMLYEKANEPKEKLGVKGAGHCMSIVKETELYWDTVDRFIAKYL